MSSIILTFSGGIDSTILLWHLRERGDTVRCLSVNYGQRHIRELTAAEEIAKLAGCEHRIIDLSNLRPLLSGSSQTSDEVEVPEGHYAAESMKLTVVPNRNMILLAVAGAWAVSTKSEAVAYAAHAGDHAIYPDCREEFASVIGQVLELCDWHPIQLWRPFIRWSKADIVKEGERLNVPFGLTWSCYKGGSLHCGKCGTCTERQEAFTAADVADPTVYQ